MGMYRDESGLLIEVDDAFAEARGYVPADPAEFGALIDEAGEAERAEQRGFAGTGNAFVNRFSSALSLGLTDVLGDQVMTPTERETVLADLEAHPYAATAGELAGTFAGAAAAPGSAFARTPAGYLGQATARSVESSLAQGGLRGTAKAIGAMGAEGAAQTAGQYIGHAALADKETTVEGLAGALGTGFAFGGAGGGAALGVVKGTMAARRLYSRVMDGKRAAETAESTWKIASQEALDSDTATMRAAEIKLDQIRTAKAEAMRYRNEARAAANEEKIRASGMTAKAGPDGETAVSQTSSAQAFEGPEPLIDVDPQTGAGGVTQIRRAPEPVTFDPSDAQAFDAGMPSTRDQLNDVAGQIKQPEGAKTGAFKAPPGSTQRIIRGEPVEPKPGQTYGPREPDIKAKIYEMRRQGRTKEGMQADRMEALGDIRYKATEDLLGPQTAKMERELQEVVDEYTAARAGLGELSDGVPEALDEVAIRKALDEPAPGAAQGRGGKTTPGRRQAREILDDAHEEALLRAKYGADPREAGRAISEAEDLENLLSQIDDTSDGVPRMVDGSPEEMFADQLANDIRKIWRYEEASAKLSDVIGEASHPTSLAKAKGFRDATKDAERKMYERTAREVDDASQFGPEYKSPKERVAYARGRLNDAQKNVDELGVQEMEARRSFENAGKKVREGEKAKKAALREDKQAMAGASRIGAQDIGGLMEIIDMPGLPKPSDLPVVGPLLGAWLKFRTLKKALGRAMGKVPATADAKVAARANQTRDRVARAVDRSLGLIERGGKYAARRMPATAGILAARIYNDGGEDPGPKASIQKQAAARMREISAYVHAPNAIELDVRRELRGVTDPDIIAAAEKHRRFMMEYILRHMPKVPEEGLLKTHDWEPSAGQAMSFARRLEAANDPAAVFEKLAQERDLVSLEAAETLRDVYPKLFQEALRRATERAAEAPGKIPYRTRVQMTVFYKQPFEAALSPENFQITQSVYDRKPSSPAYNPAAPGAAPPGPPTAQPSIANPTNLAEEYMPSFDRR